MTQLFASPSPSGPQRGWLARFYSDPESESILVGLAGVLVALILLFLLGPWFFRAEPIHPSARRQAIPQVFNIEMAPEMFPKPPPKIPPKFVEANPNAPENIPDKTNNFSDRNQQVAQEKPTKDAHSDMPKLEGRKDIESTQIVDGRLTKPSEAAPPAPPVDAFKKPSVTTPKAEQTPLTGFEKKLGDAIDGVGTNVAKFSENAKNVPNKVEGVKNVPLVENANIAEPVIDPKHPRPRPSVDQSHTRPAIFKENDFGTSNMGITACDARWSNYGVYLKRLIESVQTEWDRILIASQTYPQSGTQVTVRFKIDSKGKIVEILEQQSSSSEQGTRACVSAITNPSPYGEWTPDMVAMLGESQELTFTFFYQ